MKKINIIRLSLLTAVLSACGGAGGPSKPNVCSDLKLTHCNEVTIPVASSSSSASSEAPPVNAMLPLSENFAVSNATQFFNQAYKPLLNPNPQDPNNAFYYATSGLDAGRVVVADGKLTIGNARFTLGQRLQTTGTHIDPNPVTPIVDFKVGTTSDAAALNFPTTTTWGDLDLAHKWKISFCVPEAEALSGTTSNQQFMVYVDNNTSGSSFSIHGAKSLVKQLNVSAFVPGKRVEINVPGDILVGGKSIDSVLQNPGTTSSFIQLRVPSAGVVTMSQLWLGYQSDTSTEPSAASCTVGARVPNWNIALPPAVPVAPSFTPGNNQLTVSWPVAAGAVSYTVAWNTTNSTEGATLIEGVLGTSTTITGLQNGTSYYVFVKAVNTGGVSAYGPSAAGIPEVPATAPVTPTDLAVYGGNQSALVTWAAIDGAASYSVAVNTQNDASTATVTNGITDTYTRLTGLVNNTPYYVFVKAVNLVGSSPYSDAKGVTPAKFDVYQANFAVKLEQFFDSATGVTFATTPAVQTISLDNDQAMALALAGESRMAITPAGLRVANARFTLGMAGVKQDNGSYSYTPSTATLTPAALGGSLDLTNNYQICYTVVEKYTAGLFRIYVDNNTSTAGSSIHGTKSRLINQNIADIPLNTEQCLNFVDDAHLGTAKSFIQVNTDGNASTVGVVLSSFKIVNLGTLPIVSTSSSESSVAPTSSSAPASSVAPASSSSSSAASSVAASAVESSASSVASSSVASSVASSDVASSVSSVASSDIASSVASSSVAASSVASSDVASSSSSTASSDLASSASSVVSSAASSSASSVVAIVTRDWAFDSAAYAAADTSLFTATYTAAGDNNIKNTGDITVDGLIFNNTSATSVLRYRPAGSTGNAGLLPLWNTNGSFFTSNSVLMPAIGSDIDTTKVRAYIGVPVVAGSEFTITVNYKQTGSGATAAKVALVGSDNKVLAVKDASYATAGGTAGDSITLTVPAGHAYSAIKIFYGRETLATGGINITSIQRLQ